MPLYAYTAYTKEGRKVSATMEAANEPDAKEKIRALHLLLAKLSLDNATASREQLAKDNLVIFTSQLAQLIAAKIPLYESLLALEEQARGEPFHPVILGITERIKTGSSLSKAMADFPGSFTPLYRAMVAAGEAVGSLELSLTRLSAFLSHQRRMTKQLMSALTYPLFLAGVLVLAVIILVGFVIPSLEVLFEDREVPAFTRVILGASHLMRNWWPLLLALLCGTVGFVWWQLKQPATRLRLQQLFTRLPVAGRCIVCSALARFAKTLATLLEGGLPLTTSLAFAKEALHNAPLEAIVQRAHEQLIEGRPLSQELARDELIPPLFARMVTIGEDSGKLAPLLSQVATLYEEETERTLTRAVALAQPCLLLLMGVLIGSVLLSILLPLSDFGSTMQL